MSAPRLAGRLIVLATVTAGVIHALPAASQTSQSKAPSQNVQQAKQASQPSKPSPVMLAPPPSQNVKPTAQASQAGKAVVTAGQPIAIAAPTLGRPTLQPVNAGAVSKTLAVTTKTPAAGSSIRTDINVKPLAGSVVTSTSAPAANQVHLGAPAQGLVIASPGQSSVKLPGFPLPQAKDAPGNPAPGTQPGTAPDRTVAATSALAPKDSTAVGTAVTIETPPAATQTVIVQRPPMTAFTNTGSGPTVQTIQPETDSRHGTFPDASELRNRADARATFAAGTSGHADLGVESRATEDAIRDNLQSRLAAIVQARTAGGPAPAPIAIAHGVTDHGLSMASDDGDAPPAELRDTATPPLVVAPGDAAAPESVVAHVANGHANPPGNPNTPRTATPRPSVVTASGTSSTVPPTTTLVAESPAPALPLWWLGAGMMLVAAFFGLVTTARKTTRREPTPATDDAMPDTSSGRVESDDTTVAELNAVARAALAANDLDTFVDAALASIKTSHEPVRKKGMGLLGLAELLVSRAVSNGRAAALLPGFSDRITATFGEDLEGAVRQAVEDAGRVGSVLATSTTPENLARFQEAVDDVRELALLQAALTTVGLDPGQRRATIQTLLGAVGEDLRTIERRSAVYDNEAAPVLERALRRLEALRAQRDALQNLLLDDDPSGAAAILDAIYDRLNGTWHDPSLTRRNTANFREGGVRQRADAAARAGRNGEARRLRDEERYLENRRLAVIARTAPSEADAIRQFDDIKRREHLYWSSRLRTPELQDIGYLFGGDVPAERILPEIQSYRQQLRPVFLDRIVESLVEKGQSPEQVAQAFIRALASLRAEDIHDGRAMWAAYLSRPWYRRGMLVGNYRLWHSMDIGREMLEDQRMVEALAWAGAMPARELKATRPGAFARLESRGFIKGGAYAVPAGFIYSSDTAGSRNGAAHWSDHANPAEVGELLLTVILPGGVAARLTGGLRAAAGAGRLARLGIFGLRVGAEAGVFTALSNGARTALHGVQRDREPLVKEYLTNLAFITAMPIVGRFFRPLDRWLLSRKATVKLPGPVGVHAVPAEVEVAISRMISGIVRKPIGTLTASEVSTLAIKLGLDGTEITSEAALITALGTLPVVGHGSDVNSDAFWANALFLLELRLSHAVAGEAIESARRTSKKVNERPTARDLTSHDVAEEAGRYQSWVEPTLRSFVTQLGISWAEGAPWGHEQQTALRRLITQRFFDISRDPGLPAQVRADAAEMFQLLASRHEYVRLTFSVPDEPGPAGSFLRLYMMADVNLMTLARSAERVAQHDGRPANADDFLTVLLGTTVHEVLEHGQRQREGIHAEDRSRDNLTPVLGTRPSARLRELRSFLTQSRFDPHLGGKMPDPRTPRLLTDITAMVDSLYQRVHTELNNERLLFMIDPQRGADWLQARRRLDEFIRGESRGPEALGELWNWLDRIPLSTDKRVRLEALLTRLASEPPPEVEHFDPNGAATNLNPDNDAAAAEPAARAQSRARVLPVHPANDVPMPRIPDEGESADTLKAAILDELIFSRVIRPGTRQALRVRRAINRLRRLQGTGPQLPRLTPRSVPRNQRRQPLDIRSLETDTEGGGAVRTELDGLRRRELAGGRP